LKVVWGKGRKEVTFVVVELYRDVRERSLGEAIERRCSKAQLDLRNLYADIVTWLFIAILAAKSHSSISSPIMLETTFASCDSGAQSAEG
jgi:hypothetical protein